MEGLRTMDGKRGALSHAIERASEQEVTVTRLRNFVDDASSTWGEPVEEKAASVVTFALRNLSGIDRYT